MTRPAFDSLAQSDLVGEQEPHDGVAGHPGQHVKLMLVGQHGRGCRSGEPPVCRSLLNDIPHQRLPGFVVVPAFDESMSYRNRGIA